MRVALLSANVARTGVETHVRALARGLAAEGVEPVLVCPAEGPLTDAYRALGLEVRIDAPGGRSGLLGLPRLARALSDCDVVHAHGTRAIYWSAAVRAFRTSRPAVATAHEFRLTGHEHRWRGAFYAPIEFASMRAHDRIITVSRLLRTRLLDAGLAPPDRVIWIPNTSPALFEPPRPLPVPFRPRAVLAARLERVKGVDVLLDAWAELARDGDPPSLLVLGEGNERRALETQSRALGLERFVQFGGEVMDAPARMASEGFYVAPSRMEGLPGSVVEAMALGLPVIATAVGGHHDLLDDLAPEWLVPTEDPVALAERVRFLLALPDSQRDELSRRFQESAYARYAPRRLAAATIEVYRSVLS